MNAWARENPAATSEKEKDHLIASWEYAKNELAGDFAVENYETRPQLYDDPKGFPRYPLFEKKPVSKGRPGSNREPEGAPNKSVDGGAARASSGATNGQTGRVRACTHRSLSSGHHGRVRASTHRSLSSRHDGKVRASTHPT